MPFDSAQKQKKDIGGMNFAPIQPLREIKNKKPYECSTLASLIHELHTTISAQNVEMRREMAETGRIMAGLRSGKQVVKRNPLDGAFALLPRKPQRGLSVVPLVQVKSSELTSMWDLSRPKTIPLLFGTNIKSQIQHALITQVIAQTDERLFDVDFHQAESISMMDYGTAVIRPFYDDNINTLRQLMPVIEESAGEIFTGYGYCAACGFEDSPEAFDRREAMPRCPKCGSYDIPALIPTIKGNVSRVVGQREVTQGDTSAELLDFPACNWDFRYMAHDSSYFQYVSDVPHRLVESFLKIDIAESDATEDFGLSIIREISNRGGGAEGLGRERLYNSPDIRTKRATMFEEWYKPEWYAGVRLEKAEKTLSGETIPKNVPLDEIFPEGICAVGFDGMRVIAGIFGEKCRVVSGIYHIQSFSGVGKGTSDAIELSEQLNIAHSAAMDTIKRFGAGGGVAYDKDVVTAVEARKMLKPDGLVGVSLRGTGYNNVTSAINRIQSGEINQSNLVMTAQLTNLLNLAFQSTDFTEGAASNKVDVDTLGGQQLLAAQNQMRSSAPLRMKGFMRARVHEELMDLFREHIKIPVFFGTSDKFSLTKGRYISGSDLPEKIRCRFVLDTEHPNDKFTKRQNISQMAQESANFSGMPFAEFAQINPRMAAWFADQYGADIPQYNYGEFLIVCQSRIDELKEITAEAEMIAELTGITPPPDTFIDALTKAVEMDEEAHSIKAEIIGEYMDDDEVSEWSQIMKAAVRALINRHYKMEQQKQLRPELLKQEAQFILAANQAKFEMGIAAQQQQQQMAMAAPIEAQAEEQRFLASGVEKAVGMIEKEDDFLRDQESKELDHERNKELEQIRAKKKK